MSLLAGALARFARPGAAGDPARVRTDLRLLGRYGAAGLRRSRSPLVALRARALILRERADPAVHRARAEAQLARTLRAALALPAHAAVAARTPGSGLLDWLRAEV